MAWYNPGGGAGVWDAAKVDTDLRNILAQLCHAVNERELYRSGARLGVTSITRSSSTATVTTAASHSLSTGHYVFIIGATQSEYNGIHQVTVTGASTFTFTVTGSPASPATGTIQYVKQSSVTSFTYDDEFNTKPFPVASDFDSMPLHQITRHERLGYNNLTVSSLTSAAGVATLTVSSTAGISTGDYVEISGANQAAYNGVQQVTVTSGTTLTYSVAGGPASPATGTITAWHHGRVTQSAGTAKVRLIGHGLHTGHYVELSGCTPSDYNGFKQVTTLAIAVTSITRVSSTATVTCATTHGLATNDIVAIAGSGETEYNKTAVAITVTGATTFTYPVSGTPATPASGSWVVYDQSHFTFPIDSGVAAIATGNIKITTPAHMIYRATHSGGTARMYCKEHGFIVGQWVEVVNEDSSQTAWRFWGPITTISTDEWFEIATTSSPSSDTGHAQNDTDNAFWANRVIGIRKPMREIQDAIEDMLYADASDVAIGEIRFVEDSAPYETNYTLSNLLGDGSYGSSWLSLMGRSVETVSDALLQMKEALDLLVVTTVNETAETQSHTQYSSADYTSLQDAWDDATAVHPTYDDTVDTNISMREADKNTFTDYRVFVEYDADAIFTITQMAGTFVDGEIYLQQTNGVVPGTSDVTQDTYTITDSDGDSFAVDAAINTVDQLGEVTKAEAFFASPTKTLTFTTPKPATHPFTTAIGSFQFTNRHVNVREANASRHTRELVPGTDFTYG